jgi:hypothetical protein
MLFYEVCDAFTKAKVPYAVVGGYALALHGLVRATVDVDLVLNLKQTDFVVAERVLQSLGLQSRLPISAEDVIKMRLEYIKNRNLIAWSFVDYTNPSRCVDILINMGLKEIQVQRISVAGRKIPVATLKSLLKMKQKSGRPQDLIDVANIKERLSGKA